MLLLHWAFQFLNVFLQGCIVSSNFSNFVLDIHQDGTLFFRPHFLVGDINSFAAFFEQCGRFCWFGRHEPCDVSGEAFGDRHAVVARTAVKTTSQRPTG